MSPSLGSNLQVKTSVGYSVYNLEGGDPSAGSPTDTLLQLNPTHEAQNRKGQRDPASSKLHSSGLMGGECKEQGLIHRALVTRDY